MSNVTISGFEELRQTLSGERLSKGFKEDIDYLATSIHTSLRKAVVERYKVDPRKVDAIFAKSSGSSSIDKAIQDITYKHNVTNLATYYTGKAKSGNEGNGWYHYAMVTRKRDALVRGKIKQGGFVPHLKSPKNSEGRSNRSNFFKYKQYKPLGQKMMFERPKGIGRYGQSSLTDKYLSPIWSLSIAQMVERQYLYDTKVQQNIDAGINLITDRIVERILSGK